MAVSQRFKIEVLLNILPAGEETESDTQQPADDTVVTIGENMGTMLFKPHPIVSKHCYTHLSMEFNCCYWSEICF